MIDLFVKINKYSTTVNLGEFNNGGERSHMTNQIVCAVQ